MTTRYDIIIEANDKASKNIKAINVALTKTDTKATKAAKAMKSMGSSLGKVGFSVAKGGMKSLAAATVAATAAFVIFGTKSINALDELGKISTKLGLSTKFLSEYASVADKAGLSTTQFFTGIQRFKRRLGEAQMGAGELLKPLKALGIAIKDNNGNFRDGEEVFKDYIKSLGEMSNTDQALAFATKGFDTEGVAFINIAKLGTEAINELKQAARDAGQVVDDRLIKAAEDAKDAFSKLVEIGSGFGKQLFGNLSIPLTEFADSLRAKINEAVKGAGGMEQFARDMSVKFLEAVKSTLLMFAKLFDGVINSFNSVSNVLKGILTSLPAIMTGGIKYEFGDQDALLAGLNQSKAELTEQRRLLQAVMDDASAFDIAQGIIPFFGTILSDFADAQKEALSLDYQLQGIDESLASLANGSTKFLSKSKEGFDENTQAVIAMNAALDNTITKIRTPAIVTGVQGGDRDGGADEESATDKRIKAIAAMKVIDDLINANSKMLPIQAELRNAYAASNLKLAQYAIALSDSSIATDAQKASITELLAAETTHNTALQSRINMGEAANSVYQASTVAVAKLKTSTGELTTALELENAKTKEITPFKLALIEAIKENDIAVSRLTGTYVEAKKPMETTEEYLIRIKEAVALAANSTNNFNSALLQMQLDLIAGKGNADELAASIKYLQDQQNNTPGKLTVAEEATKRLDDLSKEITFTKDLTAALVAQGATREQLDALGFGTDKTAYELAAERLIQSREEVALNATLMEQLTNKLGLTREEAIAQGYLKEAALTASQSIAAGLEQSNIKFQNLEATLNNATAIEALAEKYKVSSAVIRTALIEAMEGMDQFQTKAVTIGGIITDTWDQMGKNMAAGIAQGIMKGEGLFNSFTGFLKNFANQVITQIIQKMLVQPMIDQMMQFGNSLMGGMSGGGGGGGMDIVGSILSAFSGGKAEGGNIPGGTFGLVGENGPEFINGPARITPMNNDINSNEGLTVNFNINAISTSDGTSFILEHKKEITGVIQNAFNKRGKQGIY